MSKFIDSLNPGIIQDWYIKNRDTQELDDLSYKFKREKYCLDKKSGLFLRTHFKGWVAERLGYTIIDLVFLRPADYHVHHFMAEGIKVLGGRGKLITGSENKEETFLRKGSQIYIEKGLPHALCPCINSFLELEVACTEIYNDTQETTLIPFNEFEPWKIEFGQ
jgi:hypothetical protein